MLKKLIFPALVFGCALTGVALGSIVTGSDPSPAGSAPVVPVGASASVADQERDTVRDRDLGVVTFRSSDGRRCFVYGTVRDGRTVARTREGGAREVPLDESPTCVREFDPALPVAFGVSTVGGDQTSVVGIARSDVASLKLMTSAGSRTVTPSAAGGFIAVFQERVDSGDMQVELDDGTRMSMKLPIPRRLSEQDVRDAVSGASGHGFAGH